MQAILTCSAHMHGGRDAVAPGQALAAGQICVAAPQARRGKVRCRAHGRPCGRRCRCDRMDALRPKVSGHHGGAQHALEGSSIGAQEELQSQALLAPGGVHQRLAEMMLQFKNLEWLVEVAVPGLRHSVALRVCPWRFERRVVAAADVLWRKPQPQQAQRCCACA